jgi:hypothetical protein
MRTKITFLLVALLAIVHSQAQNTKFAINAGVVFSSNKISDNGVGQTSQTRTGFTAGVTTITPISANFSFMPSLNFVQKGFVYKESDYKSELALNYLELPLNVVYNRDGFFAGAGPAISFGLSGKMKETVMGQTETSDVKFGSADDQFKTVEIGANFLAGYQFRNGIILSANYNFGFTSIANGDDGKVLNRYFGIKLGYVFNH